MDQAVGLANVCGLTPVFQTTNPDYADDIVVSEETSLGLQRTMDEFSEYVASVNLMVNVRKTEVISICFGPAQTMRQTARKLYQ